MTVHDLKGHITYHKLHSIGVITHPLRVEKTSTLDFSS